MDGLFDHPPACHRFVGLDVEDHPDLRSGFSISFHFDANPYFTNAFIKKDFSFHEDSTLTVTSSAIAWKEGMDLTEEEEDFKGRKRMRATDSFTKARGRRGGRRGGPWRLHSSLS